MDRVAAGVGEERDGGRAGVAGLGCPKGRYRFFMEGEADGQM